MNKLRSIRSLNPVAVVCIRCGEVLTLSGSQMASYYQKHLSVFAENHEHCQKTSFAQTLANFSGYTEKELDELGISVDAQTID